MRISTSVLSLSLHKYSIIDIFSKQYQNRNQYQHKYAVKYLQQYFNTLTKSTIKIITFYLTLLDLKKFINAKDQIQNYHGIIIYLKDHQQQTEINPEIKKTYKIIKNQNIQFQNNQNYALFINYEDYLSSIALGQSSIQQQLAFFNSSQYLCSIPRKKYYNILRNSKVLQFSFRQNIYSQGQMICSNQSGSGVYIVRHGQLAYMKNIHGKQIQVFRFSQGHLVGTIQLDHEQKKRLFTVSTKNSKCIVYHISEQFFKSFIKPYCQKVIEQKQKKLLKFLSQKSKQIKSFRSTQISFNSTFKNSSNNSVDFNQTFRNSKSVNSFTSKELPSLIKTSRRSIQIEQQELRKTSLFKLKNEGPLKTYPMLVQRAKYTTSEFKDLQKLLQKNSKINKIRQIKRTDQIKTKQQILFQMFQSSWKFNKQKRKRNISNY